MVRLHLYLLGGETDISLACFQRGLVCFWYRLALPCSETHHIITFSTLNRSSPFNFNWLHIKTPHSRSAFTCRLFCWNICRKICKEVFSFYSLNSESLNKWDDWYRALCCWKHFPTRDSDLDSNKGLSHMLSVWENCQTLSFSYTYMHVASDISIVFFSLLENSHMQSNDNYAERPLGKCNRSLILYSYIHVLIIKIVSQWVTLIELNGT